MAAETDRVEPAESEQDEGEDVYEVERIIDMRVEEGEVLYRVRWKNYCSDDDTWEPEAHLEDCREVLLTFKKALTEAKAKKEAEAKAKKEAEAKAKKEAEAKKSMKVLPTKSDLFDADSSDSDKDRPTDLPVKKKKKKQVEEPSPKEKKKKKKAKRQEDIRPLPAPETDEEDEPAPTPPPSPKKPEPKKQLDSEDEDQDPVPTKKHKKDKGKAAGKQKQRAEEGKKRKGKKEAKIETSDDDTAPIEEDISEGLSETQTDDTSTEGLKTAERIYLDDKFKEKKGKWEVKLQGFKDLIQKKESKKPDASPKESSLQKLKALTSKAKEDPAPHSSDSSDSSTAHKKTKSKDSTAPPKAQAAPSVPSVPTEVKSKAKEEKTKEDILAQKDTAGSTNLFEKFLLNCEAKDRAPRRPSVHQPPPEKSASKPIKLLGKIEKIPKPSKDSPVQKPEPERTEKVKLTEAPVSKAGQTYGFSLDSDEREVEFSPKGRPSDEARKERPEEAQRSGWDRRSSTDSKPRRREDSEPRLFMACEDPPESQEPPEPSDKTEKSQATLSLGMDLNLDWMTLDDFQKHLNGEDEVLSGPPLSPSELRDAVKSGDYLAVKLALNSKEDYNLDQEESTFGQKNCVAEERGSSDILSSSLNLVDKRNKRRVAHVSTRSMTAEIAMGDTEQSNPTDTCELASKLRRLRRKNNENNAKVKVNESCEEDAHHFVSNDKSGSNVMVKRHQPKRKIQTTLPTRTGLRTRKKEDKLDPSTEKEQKKQLGKKHVCFYCKIAFTQLSKHLEKIHAEETDVARALHFPKASKTRQTLLDQIRNKGDYEHNCKVVKSGEGEIIPKKQVKNTTASVEDFLPCQYCFAFYRKSELWRHKRLCKAKKEDVEPAERAKKGRVHSAASRLLPVSEFLTGGCEEIIHVMHQDDISRRIRNDPLICKYGNALSVKYDHDKSQFPYIAQKMRELGRFVVAVNELDSSVQFLQEICLPSRFELAVEGAKKASGFDPSSSTFKTASLVSKIGYSLKRAAEIAFGESRMKEDSESETEIKTFIDLLDTKWNDYFSHTALASAQKEEVKKMDTSTVTADLLKLHLFITQEEEEARKDILQNPSLATWKKLSEATLADVCLFNRIRVGNIGRLLLETYTSKKSTGKFLPSAEQMRKSTKLELELSERLTRLELEGQFGRSMLILLTQRMVSLINLLIEHREQVGVSSNNIYLFARSEGPSFIRGLDCLRRAAVECAVVNPEALLCPSLREQIASSWQLLSLCESELGQVAKLLGRSSQECSELSKNAILVEEVGKQLLQMHQILPSGTTGSAKEGAQSKSAVKRRPWSEKEQAAVKRFLSEFITKMKVPGKKECNACLAAEPDLCRRSWTDVKNFVHNTLQTLRRRQNQPEKPKTERSTVNPKRQKAVAQITKKHFEVNNNIACNLTTNLNDTTSMSITASSHVIEQSILFPLDMTSGYQSFCSGNSNMVCPSPTSSFSSLNVLDTQVVPTYTPLTTTNPVMHPLYSPDSRFLPPMSPSYTHNPSSIPPPSVYSPQDTDSLILPTFTSLNCPSTSMLPTYTSLNTAVFPPYSTINDRNDFASLDHSSTSFPTSPIGPSTSSQVVPTVHAPTGGPADVEEGMSAPSEHLSSLVKAQKRNKRLWSEEEQAAVRRQLGDFCELVRVPGKRDCDACLAAEPALNTRTWREVKYFVHNSIQSVKRRGTEMSPNESDMMEQETHSDWDAPVYLSL